MLLKQSTGRNLSVFMTDSSDHITGKTGLTLTITASKDGASFGSISPTVTDLGSGWYTLALTTTHTNTLGDLALHITSSGADPTDLVRQVVALLPGEAVTLQADQAVNVTKVNGTSQTAGDIVGLVGSPAGGTVAAALAEIEAETDDIAAIKAKTDTIPASPAAVGSAMTLTSAYDAAKTASQAGDVMKVSSGTGANQISISSGIVAADVKQVNDVALQGDGTVGTPWGPV